MNFIEHKYVCLVSVYLTGWFDKGNGVYQCRCPFCGDSQKSTTKRRGYFYPIKGRLNFKCHNCSISMSLGAFLENVNPALFNDYRVEMFQARNPSSVRLRPEIDRDVFRTPDVPVAPIPGVGSRILQDCERLDKLPPTHDAVDYITNTRKLDPSVLSRLWFVEDVRLVAHQIPRYRDIGIRSVMSAIVIPFFSATGEISFLQCRTLGDVTPSLRYITLEVDEDAPKIFGLDRVDWTKHVWVTEGPFDAMIVPNSIAVAGISLLSENKYVSEHAKAGFTLVFDRDYQTNYQVFSQLKKAVENGQSVLLYDHTFPGRKDLNDAIIAGWSVPKLEEYMKTHKRSGLMAKLDLSSFKAPTPSGRRQA